MAQLTYTGTVPLEHPTLRLTWEPGQTQEVPDDLAAAWDADPLAPFSGQRKKAAREARERAAAAARDTDGEQEPTALTDEQPAPEAGEEQT